MDKQLLTYDGAKKTFAIVGLLTVAQTVAIIMQAIYLAKAITQMFHGEPFSLYMTTFVLFFIAHIFRQLLNWAKERISYRFAMKTSEHLRKQLVEQLFDAGPETIGSHGSGQLITLTTEGIPKFKKYVELFIPRFLSMAITPAVLVIFILTQDVLSGITLIIVLPILIIFLILIGIVSKNKIEDQMEAYRLLSRHFLDSLRGLVTLKFLGKSESHEQAIASVSNKYRIATNRALKYAFMSSFALDFFASLSVALVAVELGMRLINGTMLLEPALLILILAPDYFLPVRELGNDFHATTDGQDAGKEIQKIINQAVPSSNESLETIELNNANTLSFIGIEKKGDHHYPILENITFSIYRQEKVGIVGLSGAGKSTLIQLLAGFTQWDAGELRVDQRPIRNLQQSAWQSLISYIPQHPTIFSGTVAENIRFYEPEATFEEVVQAAKSVGLYDLIQSFPNQFNERIGSKGRVLSGGEEQRIALARTLLRGSDIMLFDEPTAHLDIETEHEIKQVILPLIQNKTVFFATHRLHWMKNMDKILVLEQGKIVQFGCFEDLAKEEGAFQQMLLAARKGREE